MFTRFSKEDTKKVLAPVRFVAFNNEIYFRSAYLLLVYVVV